MDRLLNHPDIYKLLYDAPVDKRLLKRKDLLSRTDSSIFCSNKFHLKNNRRYFYILVLLEELVNKFNISKSQLNKRSRMLIKYVLLLGKGIGQKNREKLH